MWFHSSLLEVNLPWDESHFQSHPFLIWMRLWLSDFRLDAEMIWGCWDVMNVFSCEKDVNLGRPRAECYVYVSPKFMC